MMAPDAGSGQKASSIVRVLSFAVGALVVTYPFLVYSGWQRVKPRLLLGGALVVFGLRLLLAGLRVKRSQWKELALPWLLPGLFLVIAFMLGRRSLFLYWPAIISSALLIAFGRTLLHPPTIAERFAKLQKPALSAAEVAYCRRVTQGWCLFFIINASVAISLARAGSLKAWTLYNGLISYLLIGAFMASEYVYRHWRFRPENDLLTTWINRWTR